MIECRKCKKPFSTYVIVDGKQRNICNRKYCLDCSPFGSHNTKVDIDKPKIDLTADFRVCPCCKVNKYKTEYYIIPSKNKNVPDKIILDCKICYNKKRIARFKDVKIQAVNYKGGKCLLCGYNKCMSALAFHHLDPSTKDFRIGIKHRRCFKTIKNELDKCVVLCHNCHSEYHAGMLDVNLDELEKERIIKLDINKSHDGVA